MDFQTIYDNMQSSDSNYLSIDSGLDSLSGTDYKEENPIDRDALSHPPSKSPTTRSPRNGAATWNYNNETSLKPNGSFNKGRHSPSPGYGPRSTGSEKKWRKFRMHEGVAVPLEEMRMAVMQGNLPVVKGLMVQGISVDQILRSGWTALMFASSCGKYEVVRYLLQQGADPNMHKEMFTALMAACASCQEKEADLLQCVNLLLDFGANPDACERHRMTSLMFACKEGRVDIVARLIEARVNVDKQDNKGWTALCWAATKGYGRVARKLLECNADPRKTNLHGQRPADIALGAGHLQLAEILERAALKDINDVVTGLPDSPKGVSEPKSVKLEAFPVSHFGEMEMVLSGLDLPHLIPLFQANKITLECFLRLNENDLEKIGVEAVGTRKELLHAIALIHKQEWKTTSLPDLSGFPYIALPDAVAMVSNINKHLRFIHASVAHLRDQIQASPRILQLGQEKHTVSTLSNSFSDSLKNLSHLGDEVKFFKAHLDQVCDNCEFSSADVIVLRKDDGRQWQRRWLTSLVAATSVVTVLYFCRPKTFAWLFSLSPHPQRSIFVDVS